LTYAFSKRWENLQAALALHFAHYNFCRVHGSLRVAPAMEAGIADRVWEIADLLALLNRISRKAVRNADELPGLIGAPLFQGLLVLP
jgi:hypothetical protein